MGTILAVLVGDVLLFTGGFIIGVKYVTGRTLGKNFTDPTYDQPTHVKVTGVVGSDDPVG